MLRVVSGQCDVVLIFQMLAEAAGNEAQKKHISVNIGSAWAIILGNVCMLRAFSDEGKGQQQFSLS